MELPINNKELATIVSALRLGGDTSLYQKMNNIKKDREGNLNETSDENYGKEN